MTETIYTKSVTLHILAYDHEEIRRGFSIIEMFCGDNVSVRSFSATISIVGGTVLNPRAWSEEMLMDWAEVSDQWFTAELTNTETGVSEIAYISDDQWVFLGGETVEFEAVD